MMMLAIAAQGRAAIGVLFTAHILPHPANLQFSGANLQFSGANLLDCELEHAQIGLRTCTSSPQGIKPGTTTPLRLSYPQVNAARVPHFEPLGYADGLLDGQQEALVGFAGEYRGLPFT